MYGIIIAGLRIHHQIGKNKNYYHGLHCKLSTLTYSYDYVTTCVPIRFKNVNIGDSYIFIRTEYCFGGNLKEWLLKHAQNVDVYDIFNQVFIFCIS